MNKEVLDANQILEHLTTAVVVTDFLCRITYINQAAEQILGFSKKRGIGQVLQSVIKIDDEDRSAIESCIQDSRPFTKRQAQIFTMQGQLLNLDFTVSPIQAGSKDMLLIEFVELERMMRINREESQSAAYDTTRQLARGFAHEIKNPLGGLRGAAQLLDSELDNEDLKEYTSIITEEADRLRNLVDRMLGPNQLPNISSMNVHEALERVITLLSAESGNKMLFVKDYDPSLPNIDGDLEQLIQAILNISRNAMQALSEAGTNAPQIQIRTRIQHRHTIGSVFHPLVCKIDIIDNGPGIPEKILDDIFYPMITGRNIGTGLGLPISQSIINTHKGSIEYQSQPGRTQFSIYLPTASAIESK